MNQETTQVSRLDNFKGRIHRLNKEEMGKGGSARTPRKALTARINGMKRADLTEEQRHFIALLQNNEFFSLIKELISMNLNEMDDPKRRDVVISQLSRFLPQQVVSENVNIHTIMKKWKENKPLTESEEKASEYFQHAIQKTKTIWEEKPSMNVIDNKELSIEITTPEINEEEVDLGNIEEEMRLI